MGYQPSFKHEHGVIWFLWWWLGECVEYVVPCLPSPDARSWGLLNPSWWLVGGLDNQYIDIMYLHVYSIYIYTYVGYCHNPMNGESLSSKQYKLVTQRFGYCSFEHCVFAELKGGTCIQKPSQWWLRNLSGMCCQVGEVEYWEEIYHFGSVDWWWSNRNRGFWLND